MDDALFHRVWQSYAHLESRDVQVSLSTGATLAGRLLAVDPASGAAVLLAPSSGLLSLALGHAVTSIAPAAPSVLSAPAAAASARVLHGAAAPAPAGDAAALAAALRRMRVPAAEEAGADGRVRALVLLGGAARVRAPFRVQDCEAENETVLARVQGIVRAHVGGAGGGGEPAGGA